MKFNTTKVGWTSAMQDYAEQTLKKKLDRVCKEDVDNASISLSKINDEKMKVNISLNSFRAQAIHSDYYSAINSAATKLKQIITKHNKKYVKGTGKKISEIYLELNPEVNELIENGVSKEKIFTLNPICLEDAIKEFEQTDYPFYAYRDINDDDNINILYKRFDNTYGLIRCH